MATREYPSNSHRSKELAAESSRDKKEKVVSGKVKVKKNEKRSLINMFISEDVGSIKEHLIHEILVPGLKKAIDECISSTKDMVLYGDSGHSKRRSSSGNISYRKYYDDRRDDRRERTSNRSSRFDCDDFEFDNRADAEMVKRRMLEASDEYGLVTVADMYDFAGLSVPFTADKYGWMGLKHVDIIRTREGYILKLPKAMPIED